MLTLAYVFTLIQSIPAILISNQGGGTSPRRLFGRFAVIVLCLIPVINMVLVFFLYFARFSKDGRTYHDFHDFLQDKTGQPHQIWSHFPRLLWLKWTNIFYYVFALWSDKW
jgi:hypothetical protein